MAVFTFNNQERLRDLLANFKGFSWGSMKYLTALPLNKKSRLDKTPTTQLFGEAGVTTIGTKHLGVGYDYRTSVNNKREKVEYADSSNEFNPASLPFGQWYEGSKVIIVHTKKDETKPTYYLRVTYNSANNDKGKSELFLDNGKTPLKPELKSRIHEFQAPKKIEPKINNQGLKEKDSITVRTFKLDSILELKFAGHSFIKI